MTRHKYISKLAGVLAISLGLGSCTGSFLDTTPSNKVPTENAFDSFSSTENAVNGLYDLMSSYGYYGGTMFFYGDMKGDDIQSSYNSGRDCNNCYLFNHRANNLGAGYLWGRPYYIIRQGWNIVSAIDNNKIQDATTEDLAYLKGEALAVIALCHFDLTRCFGYPYTKDNGVSWGAPIVERAIGLDENPERKTVAEDYNFIIKTLNDAIPLMTTDKMNGRMNQYAARMLLSRVYLYMGNEEEAYNVSSKLIEELKKGNEYKLYTNEEYLKSWNLDEKFGTESLFEIANASDDNEGRNSLAYLMHPYGYEEMFLTESFMELMNKDKNDVRYQLIGEVTYNKATRYWLKKWPGSDDTTPASYNNYVVFRLSELYLIAAEAALTLTGEKKDKGLEYLNEIVSRGNPDNSVDMDEYTLERVLEERRKELVGEGHRFFDVLRNGMKITRTGNLHMENAVKEIDWNYEKCVLPIPEDQFVFNPDMEQNPGYSKF